MTDKGKTLTIQVPTDQNHPEQYALRSAGNIYYFFKTALAENYLLKNKYYQYAVPDVYRTDLRPNPLYVEGTNGVEIKANPQLKKLLGYTPPYVYKFLNGTHPQPSGAPKTYQNVTVKIRRNGSDQTFLPPVPGQYLSSAQGWYGQWYAPYAYYSNKSSGNNVSVSSGIEKGDPGKARKIREGWTPENPLSDPPATNPLWTGFPPNSSLQAAMVADNASHGVTSRALPIGAGQKDPHILIEPLTGADDEDETIRKYKFETYANIRFNCVDGYGGADAACAGNGYALKVFHPETESWETYNLGSAAFAGVSFKNLYDYRLGGAYRVIDIDIPAFLQAVSDIYRIDFSDQANRPVIYVQTVAPDSWKTGKAAPVLVRLRNGAKLPASGLSVVTNGRLWVLGDYNITATDGTVCSADSIKSGACNPPPADLYSDSFGFLANAYDKEHGYLQLNTRIATTERMLNAAVVTGQLPSQLVKKKYYPFISSTFSEFRDSSDCVNADTNPDIAPCHTYSPVQPLEQPAFATSGTPPMLNAAQDPSTKIWYLNPESQFFKEIKDAYAIMNTPGSSFNKLRTATEPKLYEHFTISCDRRQDRYGNWRPTDTPYTCGDPVPDPKPRELSVKTMMPPSEYFRDVDPKLIPIFEAVTDNMTASGIFNGHVAYYEDVAIYTDGNTVTSVSSEPVPRPFPTTNYPGIYTRRIVTGGEEGSTFVPPRYVCIQDVTDIGYSTFKEVKVGGTPEKPEITYEWQKTGSTYRIKGKCKCDTDSEIFSHAHSSGDTIDPHVSSETKDGPIKYFAGHPSWPNRSDYIGTGICPDEKDNYFTRYPVLRYIYRRYDPLWERKYSGGIENLINFQEKWIDATDTVITPFHFRGSLVVGWDAKYLRTKTGVPAYFVWEAGSMYYKAPLRDYSFNSTLRKELPPLPERSRMSVFSIQRKHYTELDPETGQHLGVQHEN
ncbi:MAG: hypothetical protein BWY49_00266 [Candidatus Omnitrophica bacterium ADurb.Bin314]|nr:MAG: hypothetical protein BWY49_00266 [Candidatus Omnitrophica bacterium ADurb.Bin314]